MAGAFDSQAFDTDAFDIDAFDFGTTSSSAGQVIYTPYHWFQVTLQPTTVLMPTTMHGRRFTFTTILNNYIHAQLTLGGTENN